MAVADTKKCQTLINAAAAEALIIRAAVARLKLVRTAYQTANPSTVGTVLDGNTAALNASLNAIDTEIAKAVWDTLIGGVVQSHRGEALN